MDLAADDRGRQALTQAKRIARSLDGVRGVDYGYTYRGGERTTRLGIRFHMHRKRGKKDVPRDQRLPDNLGGVEVDVLSAGYRPHNGNPRGPQTPLAPGLSIGNAKTLSTGSLCTFVRSIGDDAACILSNWHVLCGAPEAAAGDPISQPGPMDAGSSPTAEVATLLRWLKLSQQFDAAVAVLKPDVAVSGTLFGTNVRPGAVVTPAVGMRVLKSGAMTGVTHGIVDGIGGSYQLDYTNFGDAPEWMLGFRVVPDPAAPATDLSLDGDSGSLWVTADGGNPVGLHFAGEDDNGPLNEYALAHSLESVLQRLNVSLATPA
jgi:hypothetical protein